MFIVLDGIDGAGKSTQGRLLAEWLTARGQRVVTCRDPGSTALGERLRTVLLEDWQTPIARTSEMLLYMAARAQLVSEVIAPALARGETVVSDRFLLANVVYQGYGGGLDVEALWRIGRVATQGIEPDLTLVLDLPLAAAAGRLGRELDRMEQQGEEFRARIRQGFLTEAARRPESIRVLDAERSVAELAAEIQALVAARLADAIPGLAAGAVGRGRPSA